MDPPQCVQNAMMTKDKKPFTYTPGGIDLSEVRSPRMQRRIERNANLGGASEVPQQGPPRPQNVGPLPPATLAAMRPQPQVQVFPSPPPPPPMSKNIPPPPPPPACPLPTQKVTTGDNQVLERPDMTKIIPDNPMALLRKTGGPAPKKSFIEQMYEEQNKNPPSPPQRAYEAQSPRNQPPVIERSALVSPPIQQQRQPQPYQPPPQQYQPPSPLQQYQQPTSPQNQYPQQSYQPQYQPVQPPQLQYQPAQVQQRSVDSPKSPSYQPPIIERQPTMGRQDQPQKTVSSSVGSLYIPPLNQQPQPAHQQKFTAPPTPPDREPQVQSPGTPTLKEAPKPWQQKNVQQQQAVPPWAKRDDEEKVQTSQLPQSAPSQRWQQQSPPQQPTTQQVRQPSSQQYSPRTPPTQNSFPVHIEIRAVPYPQDPEPEERNPNAVYVTQPIVLQHPGPRIAPPYQGQPKPQQQQSSQNSYQQPRQQTQQKPKVDSSGARIIPIQIERDSPSTPGAERGLNRQLSWGSQPTQSNSFKVIQKITKTDDDEDDDTPLTQHSPRYPQEMPEQVRRMKINDNGHFKQGNGQPQPYVHPSEQVVPEPKKYMGSNIPSRSFKILQAMTAPSDGCANANYNEELPYNPVYNPYSYPYYPPPYWPDYYANYYPQEQPEQPKHNEKSSTKNGRNTPLPNATQSVPSYWHDYYPNFYPQQQSDSSSKMSEKSTSTKSGRSTPLPTVAPIPPLIQPPFWGYGPGTMASSSYIRSQSTPPKVENIRHAQTPKPSEYHINCTDETLQYPPYPMYSPYYDPYYYSYYYGYPPMIPPYPYYHPSNSEYEEYSGYSSQDEMACYNNSRKPSLKRRNSLENSSNSVHALKQHFEVRSKSATPRITITPSFSQEKLEYNAFLFKGREDSETEVEEESPKGSDLCSLRSIKSVQNISVYATECSDSESTESEDSSGEETEEEEEEEDKIVVIHDGEEIIPHQLSIIYEESERGDSRRSFRPSSVTSETTTIAEHHSEEEDFEDFLATQNVKYKINIFQETTEHLSVKSSNRKDVKVFGQEKESFTSLTVKNEPLADDTSLFEIKNDQSKCVAKNYETDIKTPQEELSGNKNLKDRTEFDNKLEVLENKNLNQSYSNQNYRDMQSNGTTSIVNNANDKENNEDRWGVVESDSKTKVCNNKENSIKKEENECDNMNSKAEYVMMREEENEVVSVVKLRNKSYARRNSSSYANEDTREKKENVKSNVNNDLIHKTDPEYNRSSVYDILKDDEEKDEVESGGTLMKVGSFVSALEAIKRNSGLWNFEEIDFSNPPTINEETVDYENQEIIDNINNKNEMANETNVSNDVDYDEKQNLLDETANQSEESEIDFWSQIKSEEDDFKPRRKSQYFEEEQQNIFSNTQTDIKDASNSIEEKGTDSASSRHSSFSKSQFKTNPKDSNKEDEINNYNKSLQENHYKIHENFNQTYKENVENSEQTSESESSEEEQEEAMIYNTGDPKRDNNSRSRSLEPQTIKERIEALRNSIAQKQKSLQEKEEINVSVRGKISAIEVPSENRSKTTSNKSSVKSFEEYSEEEEGDSGVISDISRHISDNEEFPELKKLTRYERAATHSRLFKLLQDECDIEEEEEDDDEVFLQQEDKFSKLSVRQNRGQNKIAPSRSKLSLALNKNIENTNGPQVNEKLVDELVQSLLRSRKAQVFRSMPKEKLRAAAIIILQEGIEGCETPSEEFSSLISPLRGETENSTPAQTPQEFYADNNEYKQYYDTWNNAVDDTIPSKAFKLLQEHIGASKLGTIEGILAKYPKILSNKNISKEILKHLDELSSSCSSPYSQNLPQSNDVTNT